MTSLGIFWTLLALFLISSGFATGAIITGDAWVFFAASMVTAVTAIACNIQVWASA